MNLTRPLIALLGPAAERLEALNPGIKSELHDTQLDDSNAVDLVGDYDVVIEGVWAEHSPAAWAAAPRPTTALMARSWTGNSTPSR